MRIKITCRNPMGLPASTSKLFSPITNLVLPFERICSLPISPSGKSLMSWTNSSGLLVPCWSTFSRRLPSKTGSSSGSWKYTKVPFPVFGVSRNVFANVVESSNLSDFKRFWLISLVFKASKVSSLMDTVVTSSPVSCLIRTVGIGATSKSAVSVGIPAVLELGTGSKVLGIWGEDSGKFSVVSAKITGYININVSVTYHGDKLFLKNSGIFSFYGALTI